MTSQTPDDGREPSSYEIAYQKIGNLLQRLHDKNVCPDCTARALALHAAEMFEEMIVVLREHNVLAPSPGPSSHMH
jgi:hypothetical protein